MADRKERIGWIGTGVMGSSMCGHILKEGYSVTLYNRTKEKAADLLKNGAQWADTPKEVALHSDIVFTIVGYPKDVETVILTDCGVLAGLSPGSVIVDMTTSEPSLAETIAAEAHKKKIETLDAPVSGGDLGAKKGSLAIMCGGHEKTFNRVLPLLNIMGENITLMGGPGKGQHTKMCNQILVAGNMIGTVESLLYAYKNGMDMEAVIEVIGKGAASSWAVNNLGPRIAKDDYSPGFYIKHFVKDMGIALHEAHKMNLALPGLSLVNQFYISAMAMGYENLGTQGLYKVLQILNSSRL